jgi:UDP-N-acetylglucosamine 2-epimerase (non-hydrolysing)
MKVLNGVGTRPNFVKIALLLGEMRKCQDLEALLVHTGQHDSREMSDCFLRELKIPPPDFRLRLDPDAHGTRKEQMRQGLSGIMQRARPDVAVVVGDVDSTVAAALAASDLGIPVAHVEAGLRSFDQSMPEEINRIVTDSVSSLFFASEPSAVRNLLTEGYPAERIFLVGNVMIDALRRFEPAARESAILGKLGLLDESSSATRYVFATLHRPGTVDCPAILARVWKTLEEIAATIPVVFPAHPRTRVRLLDSRLEVQDDRPTGGGRILMIPPQPYIDFLRLESEAALVMTDSGGVQEETTVLGRPLPHLKEQHRAPNHHHPRNQSTRRHRAYEDS